MTGPAEQSGLLCPSCGGQCLYVPETQGLTCQSCGNVRSLETDEDHLSHTEYPFDPEAPQEERTEIDGTRAHQCKTCGGEIVFTGPALSERCPYCDGPVVLGPEDPAFETMALVPFRVNAADALKKARYWVSRRRAAPGNLLAVVETARVAGLYAPFWTFDSHEAVDYWAKYVTGSGKHRRTHKISGAMTIAFDDLLMPASHHVTPLIRDGILHDFHPNRLRPFRAGYLAGFAAERHHQSVGQGLRANADDKRLLIRNRIKRHINKSRVTDIRYKTDTTGIHYRRILLPVWILHYRYADKPYKVVVSGIDGRTFGERPYSQAKILGYSALIVAATIVFGLIVGTAFAY